MIVGARIGIPAIVGGVISWLLVPYFVSIEWLKPGDPFRKITFLIALTLPALDAPPRTFENTMSQTMQHTSGTTETGPTAGRTEGPLDGKGTDRGKASIELGAHRFRVNYR